QCDCLLADAEFGAALLKRSASPAFANIKRTNKSFRAADPFCESPAAKRGPIMRQTRLRSSTAFPSTNNGYWCASALLLGAALMWAAAVSVPAHGQESSPAQFQSADPAPGSEQVPASPSPAAIADQNDSGVLPEPQSPGVPSQTIAQ